MRPLTWNTRLGELLWDVCLFLTINITCIPLGHAGMIPGMILPSFPPSSWTEVLRWTPLGVALAAVLVANRTVYLVMIASTLVAFCVSPCLVLGQGAVESHFAFDLLFASLVNFPFLACLAWRIILLYRIVKCTELGKP